MGTIQIISFFGGVMLVLYGMRLAGEGLQKAAGAKLRGFLLNAANNRFKGMAVGAAITALFQSSSATTVMLVGFVGSGLIGLKETMGIILGADIGTTLTVQLLAFHIYDYALALAGVGILLKLLGGRGTAEDVGSAVLGFGFIFFGLKVLTETFGPIAQNPLLKEMLYGMSKDPVAGVIVSALLTALFHSSAAMLGLAITAAQSGFLSIDAALPMVLGANIGTCVSAITSSIGAPADAKRVALAHVLFKVAGVILVWPFFGVFTGIVGHSSIDPSRQVAIAHTIFNVAIAVVFVPFTGPFTALVKRLMPERAQAEKFGPKYLDPFALASPSLALVQASRECARLADAVEEMVRKSVDALEREDMAMIEEIEEKDNDVDLLDREIKLYVAKISRESLSAEQSRRAMEIILFSDNMENIGDVIDKNLMELARKRIRDKLVFSKEGSAEIRTIHQKVLENFKLGVAAFSASDRELATRLVSHKAKLSEMERDMRQAHIHRLYIGLRESIDTSAIHLDVLTNLKRVNSYITNIAYPILEKDKT